MERKARLDAVLRELPRGEENHRLCRDICWSGLAWTATLTKENHSIGSQPITVWIDHQESPSSDLTTEAALVQQVEPDGCFPPTTSPFVFAQPLKLWNIRKQNRRVKHMLAFGPLARAGDNGVWRRLNAVVRGVH